MLDQLCRDLLADLGNLQTEDDNLTTLIRRIGSIKPDLAKCITHYRQAYEARQMLQTDYEMRQKIPDIWQIQLSRLNHDFQQQRQILLEQLRKNGHEALVKRYLPDV